MNYETSHLAKIENHTVNPWLFFKHLTQFYKPSTDLTMNLATLDCEFGILNRTVLYRKLKYEDGFVAFVTQRHTRNYEDLIKNPQACITFYMPNLMVPEQGKGPTNWQIRLINANGIEITSERELDALWDEEPLYAKIRAYICECGKPIEYDELLEKHKRMVNEHESGQTLKRPSTYTAFKFEAKIWDFYKSAERTIADRVQYRLQTDGTWLSMHVST